MCQTGPNGRNTRAYGCELRCCCQFSSSVVQLCHGYTHAVGKVSFPFFTSSGFSNACVTTADREASSPTVQQLINAPSEFDPCSHGRHRICTPRSGCVSNSRRRFYHGILSRTTLLWRVRPGARSHASSACPQATAADPCQSAICGFILGVVALRGVWLDTGVLRRPLAVGYAHVHGGRVVVTSAG